MRIVHVKFFNKIFLLILTSLLVLIAFINVRLSSKFVEDTAEYQMAQVLAVGSQRCEFFTVIDERSFKKHLLNSHKIGKDILVLGSSRVMPIRLGNGFNAGVSGADLEDRIALFEVYRKKFSIPKVVVIGCDPWILKYGSYSQRWEFIFREYLDALSFLSHTKNLYYMKQLLIKTVLEVKKLLSFKGIFKFYFKEDENKKIFRATKKFVGKGDFFSFDGSSVYRYGVNQISNNDVNKQVQNDIKNDNMYMVKNLDFKNMLLAEKFIKKLSDIGVRVILYICPYHPRVYDYFLKNNKYRMVLKAEDFFRRMTKYKNVSVVGGYDPQLLDLTEDDFFDCIHLREESVNRVFNTFINQVISDFLKK